MWPSTCRQRHRLVERACSDHAQSIKLVDKPLRQWMTANRLDGFSQLVRGVDKNDSVKMEILQRMKSNGLPAMMKCQQFYKK